MTKNEENRGLVDKETMLHRESQISIRPLCSDMLFTPIDYMFVICLTKCMS